MYHCDKLPRELHLPAPLSEQIPPEGRSRTYNPQTGSAREGRSFEYHKHTKETRNIVKILISTHPFFTSALSFFSPSFLFFHLIKHLWLKYMTENKICFTCAKVLRT